MQGATYIQQVIDSDPEGEELYVKVVRAVKAARLDGALKHAPDSWKTTETVNDRLGHAINHAIDAFNMTQSAYYMLGKGPEELRTEMQHAICSLAIAYALWEKE